MPELSQANFDLSNLPLFFVFCRVGPFVQQPHRRSGACTVALFWWLTLPRLWHGNAKKDLSSFSFAIFFFCVEDGGHESKHSGFLCINIMSESFPPLYL